MAPLNMLADCQGLDLVWIQRVCSPPTSHSQGYIKNSPQKERGLNVFQRVGKDGFKGVNARLR